MKKILFILAIRAAINMDSQQMANLENFSNNELSPVENPTVENLISPAVSTNPAAKENNPIPEIS